MTMKRIDLGNRPGVTGLTAALAFALPLCAPAAAQAHQIWLEQNAKSGKLYFGEYAENMRELSPGRLDKFINPTATLLSPKGDKPITLSKTADGFALPTRAAKGEALIVQDTGYPLLSRKAGGPAKANAAKPAGTAATAQAKPEEQKPVRTLWTPAARFVTDFSAQAAKLPLDIVPTGKTGEFQVVFQGKPLPAVKIDVAAVSGWGREAETDTEGKVHFSLPWKGGYLVKVHHVDNTPGKRKTNQGEEAYDMASYSTTLSFVTPTGFPSPPPPPAQKPHEEPPVTAKSE